MRVATQSFISLQLVFGAQTFNLILIPCTSMYFWKSILYLEYCAVHNSCRCCHEDIGHDVTLHPRTTIFLPKWYNALHTNRASWDRSQLRSPFSLLKILHFSTIGICSYANAAARTARGLRLHCDSRATSGWCFHCGALAGHSR